MAFIVNAATNDLFSLRERVVLLTGSTGHLGQALARGLCQAGATLVLNARSEDELAQQAAALSSAGGAVRIARFDVADDQQRQEGIAQVGREFKRLDVLIHNAYGVPVTDTKAAFHHAYQVAVVGGWALVQDALEWLGASAQRNPGGASVVYVASMYGVVSPDPRIYTESTKPNPPFYGPAKAGVIQLTRYLACQLGPKRIRVNAVSPGPFPAPCVTDRDLPFRQRLEGKNPLGRIGQPEELVGPIVFLASDAASYVTGANLPVDGGWTAW